MGAVACPLAEGTRVKVFLDPRGVSLRAGSPGRVWAMTHPDSLASVSIRFGLDDSVTITAGEVGGAAASGRNSVAYVQDADQTASTPQPDETSAYTVIAPAGTTVEFYQRGVDRMMEYVSGRKLVPIKVITIPE